MMLVTNIVDMANNYHYTGYYSLLKTSKQKNGILRKKLMTYRASIPSSIFFFILGNKFNIL
jgi:hypothetical protein